MRENTDANDRKARADNARAARAAELLNKSDAADEDKDAQIEALRKLVLSQGEQLTAQGAELDKLAKRAAALETQTIELSQRGADLNKRVGELGPPKPERTAKPTT